jgi:predicted transcriptional regulator
MSGTSSSTLKGRKISLPDEVHDRLWLLARQRKQSVSAVANDLLDRALPRWELKRQG